MSLYDSIIITGAGGMLGNAFNEVLRARGKSAVALSRSECDISDDAHINRIFDHKPTLLLNCAAHTKVDLCEQEKEKANAINGYAVGKMASLSRQHGTFLVHISTDFVFDGSMRRPYRVDDPVNPINAYGRSKLLGETELQKYAPRDWLIARTAWVYGRHGASFPRTMVQVAQAGKPLSVVSDQQGSPTYTVDLATAILDLLDRSARGIFHVTNAGQTNWCDFARATLKQFQLPSEVTALTSAQWMQMRPQAALRPGYSVLDIAATEAKLARPMRPWPEALKDFHLAVNNGGGF